MRDNIHDIDMSEGHDSQELKKIGLIYCPILVTTTPNNIEPTI